MRRFAAIVIAVMAACGCERHAPEGAEAAASAADQPKPVISAVTPAPAATPSAQAFVADLGAADAFEIAAAEVAQKRAQNPAVKAFAALMIEDHSRAAQELRTAVAQSGQSLEPAGGMGPRERDELAKLSSAATDSFDKVYIRGQVATHQTTLAKLQTYAQDGDVPSLKAHAGQAASTVQHHLDEAKRLQEQLP